VTIPESLECAELRNIKFIEVRGYTAEDGMTLKEYTNMRGNFGNIIANSDLKTYNEVLKLTSQPEVKHIFGIWEFDFENHIWYSPYYQYSGEYR